MPRWGYAVFAALLIWWVTRGISSDSIISRVVPADWIPRSWKCKPALGASLAELPDDCDPPLLQNRNLRRGVLNNGLQYLILKTSEVSNGNFKATLHVLSGSTDEEEDQLGLAHFVEHLAAGKTGLSELELSVHAYTSFASTVYYVQGTTQDWLNQYNVMNVLGDVMEMKVKDAEIERERAIILSELSMVNDNPGQQFWRKEVASCFRENILPTREPIGRESQIRSFTNEDVMRFYRTHYRPNNAVLYVVGDIRSTQAMENEISSRFSRLRNGREDRKSAQGTLKETQSRHFPPIDHHWSTPSSPLAAPNDVSVYRDEEIFIFSFSMRAKSPIEQVTTLRSLRRHVLKQLGSEALNHRMSKASRKAAAAGEFSYQQSAFQSSRWPFFGCEVQELHVRTNDPQRWKTVVTAALREARRIVKFGLTSEELELARTEMLLDDKRTSTSSSKDDKSDPMTELEHNIGSGDAVVDREYFKKVFREQVRDIGLDEMNEFIRELWSYVLWFDQNSTAPAPNSILVVTSSAVQDLDRDELIATLKEAANEEVDAMKCDKVPTSLMSDEEVAKLSRAPGAWTGRRKSANKLLTLGKLSNGMNVNILKESSGPDEQAKMYRDGGSDEELDKMMHVRASWPGGSFLESETFEKSAGSAYARGSIALGARTLEEGARFGEWSHEEIANFLERHRIVADMTVGEYNMAIDISFPSEKFEFVLQLLRGLMTDYNWDVDAYELAKKHLKKEYREAHTSAEKQSLQVLLAKMNGDRIEPWTPEELNSLDMDKVGRAVRAHMATQDTDLSILGDFDPKEVEKLVLQYVGTLPATPSLLEKISFPPIAVRTETTAIKVATFGGDVGAVVYIAGAMSSIWGFESDGNHVTLKRNKSIRSPSNVLSMDPFVRRQHPLFAYVVLPIVKLLIGQKIFLAVRETENLAYHAYFDIHSSVKEQVNGAFYYAKAYVEPENAQQALELMKKTLLDLMKWRGPKFSQKDFDQFRNYVDRTKWTEKDEVAKLLDGIQHPANELISEYFMEDVQALLATVTLDDAQYLMKTTFDFDANKMFACVGVSGDYKPEQTKPQFWEE